MRRLLRATAGITVALLISIFVFLLVSALPLFSKVTISDFLLGTDWNPTAYTHPTWGIKSLVVSTFLITVTSLVLSAPLGLAIAIYLSELAPAAVREIIKPSIEMLASIPTVILGLLGLLFVSPAVAQIFHLSNGLNTLTASLLVAIATLPTIASICEDALSSVSYRLREVSLALGASHWITIKRVVIPAAESGLIAALMLGLGRIIGETMIVLMVAGNSRAFPHSLLDPVRPMTAAIAIEIKEVVVGSLHWHGLFAIGLTLFLLTFLINLLADLLIAQRTMHD